MNARWQRYKRLELIPDSVSPRSHGAADPVGKGFWQALEIALFRDLEARLWHSVDQMGHTCWHLYDPQTGKTRHLRSQTEVRHWLEQVFHRR